MTRVVTREAHSEVAAMLAEGGVVALPTDTVYGVAARVDRPEAVARLFDVKKRPLTVALPVLISHRDHLDVLGVALSLRATALVDRYWPGALTVVVAAPPWLARRIGAVTNTVGLRLPGDEWLRTLLDETGPLVVSSANAHGAAPCCDADEVVQQFLEVGLSAVVDGGRCDHPVSTVVDLSGSSPTVLRQGAITIDDATLA